MAALGDVPAAKVTTAQIDAASGARSREGVGARSVNKHRQVLSAIFNFADQEALVAGVRQRTGTLLAAHALVAFFLGAATTYETGLDAWEWIAISLLVLGLAAAGVPLASWTLSSRSTRASCAPRSTAGQTEVDAGTPWLARGGGLWLPGAAREERRVTWMSGVPPVRRTGLGFRGLGVVDDLCGWVRAAER
jgi:hypothetical protein